MPEYQKNFSLGDFRTCVQANPKWTRLYAEGDSWFAYPDALGQSSILRSLTNKKRCCTLSRAGNGHTLESMLSAKPFQRPRLIQDLSKYEFDAILLSGGGNDIAGDEFLHLLHDWKPGMTAMEAIRHETANCKMQLLRYAMLEFIHIRDTYQEGTPIFVHEYALPFPDGRPVLKNLGPLRKGPWLKPSLDMRGIPAGKQRAVTSWFLKEYKEMLRSLEGPLLKVVRTQTLLTKNNEWHNELHPKKKGFRAIAKKFHEALHPLFPETFK